MTNEYKYISDDLESIIKKLDTLEIKDLHHKHIKNDIVKNLDEQRIKLINLSYKHEILYNGRL